MENAGPTTGVAAMNQDLLGPMEHIASINPISEAIELTGRACF